MASFPVFDRLEDKLAQPGGEILFAADDHGGFAESQWRLRSSQALLEILMRAFSGHQFQKFHQRLEAAVAVFMVNQKLALGAVEAIAIELAMRQSGMEHHVFGMVFLHDVRPHLAVPAQWLGFGDPVG